MQCLLRIEGDVALLPDVVPREKVLLVIMVEERHHREDPSRGQQGGEEPEDRQGVRKMLEDLSTGDEVIHLTYIYLLWREEQVIAICLIAIGLL